LFALNQADNLVSLEFSEAARWTVVNSLFKKLRKAIEENNSYEDLLAVVKNHYPNLRGCSLRSVKRFCSYHGIKKRISVANETVNIAVQGAISEVRCPKSIIKRPTLN